MFPKLVRAHGGKQGVNRGHRLAQNLVAFYRYDPVLVHGLVVRDLMGNVDAELESSAGVSSCRRYHTLHPCSGIFSQAGSDSLQVPGSIWTYLGTTGMTFCFWQSAFTYPNIGSVWDTVGTHFGFALGNGSTDCTTCRVYFNGNQTATLTLSMTLKRQTVNRIVVSTDGNGNAWVWINGRPATSGTYSTTIIGGFTNPISFGTGLGGMAGNRHDGGVGDLCLHNVVFDDTLAALDYQEAERGFPLLLPRHSIYGKAFSGINDDAVVGDIGTITVTAPTSTATAASTATSGNIGTITVTAPTATAYQNTDATATGSSPGTITVTAPTATAFESSDGTATSGTIGTVTVTAPTASATGSVTVTISDIGSILVTAPTSKARPDYVYAPRPSYRGRFLRGSILPITLCFTEQPDEAPTARVFRNADLVEILRIPVVDEARRVFGLDLLLDTAYLNGNYTVVYLYAVDGNAQWSTEYFEVLGGTGRPPVVAMVEQKRPLGRAIEYFDRDGVGRLGYGARLSE